MTVFGASGKPGSETQYKLNLSLSNTGFGTGKLQVGNEQPIRLTNIPPSALSRK